jgi:Ca2+-transporting ATPase
MVARALLQGAGAFAAAALMFVLAMRRGLAVEDVRLLAFATLIAANFALIVSSRSLAEPAWRAWRRPNPALRWMALAAVCVLVAIGSVPMLRDVFRLGPLHVPDVVAIAAASTGALAWMEAVKRLLHARTSD